MTSWNYRIVRFKDKECRNGHYYKVQEVYYNKKQQPTGCCDIGIGGETIKECFLDLMLIANDMSKAFLEFEEIKK